MSVTKRLMLLASVGLVAQMPATTVTAKPVAKPAAKSATNTAPSNGPIGGWGVDLTGRDLSVKPGNDFDTYANGAWKARTTIPADRPNIGTLALLERGADVGDAAVGQVFDPDEIAACALQRADQFVELGLHRGGVAVLRILDHEDHEERDDGRPGVDHQLPGVGPAEQRPGHGPADNDRCGEHESRRLSGPPGNAVGECRENFVHDCKGSGVSGL